MRKVARDRLFDMVSEFNFNSAMKGEALRLFTEACDHKVFRKLGEDKKISLAGCCIYSIIRQYGWGVSLSTISNYLGVDPCHLNCVYKSLKKEFELPISAPDVEDIVAGFLKNLKFDQNATCTQVADRMQKILHVTKQTLISTGVSFQPLLTATCYIAWCSLQKAVKKKSFKNFCSDLGLNPSPTSYKRLDELTIMLTELCKQLPWIDSKIITKNTVLSHLDSILKFACSLVTSKPDIFEVCVERRKRKIRQVLNDEEHPDPNMKVSDSPELNEDDMSASEIAKYIRTPEEIKHIESLL